MKKVTLKVEIEEEEYKQINGDSVYDNNKKCIIGRTSSAYYALNAIINATPLTESDDCISRQDAKISLVQFMRGEKSLCECINDCPSVKPITESEDAMSRQYIESKVEELENICANAPEEVLDLLADIKNAPSVLPKCEQGEWIKDDFTGLIKCSRCKNDAPISTVSGTQYESDFCQSCGAEMR